MSRRKTETFRVRADKQKPQGAHREQADQADLEWSARRQRYFEIFLVAAFLAFGVYQSILYFGYTVVPNGDFPAFYQTGKDLLSLKIPSSFKRGPVLGILQVCLSCIVGGQYPDLTAGRLLNAVLHPFSLLLVWLVGKRIIGKSAPWLAVVAILNPQVLYLLTEPIAETTLLFFILLTFHFIFRRSNWCYLFASITTMVRFEGLALIMTCFVMDMIHRTGKRERVRAFLYSAIATVPFILWMLGTFANWQTENYLQLFGKEYSKLYAESAQTRTGFVRHINVLWQTGFYPLLLPYPGAGEDFIRTLWKLSMTVGAVGFVFGSAYGLCKRNWNILVLLLFFVPYFLIHIKFPSPLPRYYMPVVWIALLICLFGLQSAWKVIDKGGRVPEAIKLILQAPVVIAAVIWLIALLPYLPKLAQVSPRSVSLPYVAIALVGLVSVGRLLVYTPRRFLRELSILSVVCLIIVSNQFAVVRTLGDGQREREFKDLAGWYVANAKPGEKMGLYMAEVVRIFAPRYADDIVYLPKADNPEQFIRACYEQNITYVVWATREGLSTDHTGYRQANLDKNLAALQTPKDVGPYEFVGQVGSQKGYVNIFRLRRPQDNSGYQAPQG